MVASSEIETMLHLFDDKFAEIEELLAALPAEALQWKPFEQSPWKGPSGRLGWILAHNISSTVYLVRRAQWVLGRIEWSGVDGDEGREEFGPANNDPAYMAARAKRAQAWLHETLPTFSLEDLEQSRPNARRPDVVYNVRRELLHALEHMSQHNGQAQVTRQLWAIEQEKAS